MLPPGWSLNFDLSRREPGVFRAETQSIDVPNHFLRSPFPAKGGGRRLFQITLFQITSPEEAVPGSAREVPAVRFLPIRKAVILAVAALLPLSHSLAVPIDAYLDISNSSLINQRRTVSDSLSVTAEHEGRSASVVVTASTVQTAHSYAFTANGEVSASPGSRAYALAGCGIDPAGYWSYVQPNLVSLEVHNPYNDEKTYVFKEPMTFTGSYSLGGNGTIPSFKAFLAEEDGLLNWTRGNGTFSVWDPFWGSQTLGISTAASAYGESFVGTVGPGTYKIGAAAVWVAYGSDPAPRKGSMSFTINFTPAPAQPSIGGVSEVNGTASVIRAGMSFAFVPGDAVYPGDVVETAAGSSIKMTLSDETLMTLGPESRMKVERLEPESPGLINLIRGKVRAKVKKDFDELDPNEKAKFFIKTNSGGFVIRGTELKVTYSEIDDMGTSQLDVIEGVVEMVDYHLGTVTKVIAGQSGTLVGPVENWFEEEDYEAIPTLAPEIAVYDSESNEMTSELSEVDWGTVSTAGSGVEKSFLIRNIWTSDLTDIAVSISGEDAGDFILTIPPADQLPGGAGSEFKVKFKPSASGLRSAILEIESNDGSEYPFLISLTGTGGTSTGTALQNWASTAGLPPGLDGPAHIPQSDGVPNLLKFSFNLNPLAPDVRTLGVGANGTAGLPGAIRTGGKLRLEFIRRKAATQPGIAYLPQFSSDAMAWVDVAGNLPATSIDSTWERVVVDDPEPGVVRFGRLKVVEIP